ncbi:MAG: hypothetical protein ACYCOO_09210, partial [Chitinophagaceae bacterium]
MKTRFAKSIYLPKKLILKCLFICFGLGMGFFSRADYRSSVFLNSRSLSSKKPKTLPFFKADNPKIQYV